MPKNFSLFIRFYCQGEVATQADIKFNEFVGNLICKLRPYEIQNYRRQDMPTVDITPERIQEIVQPLTEFPMEKTKDDLKNKLITNNFFSHIKKLPSVKTILRDTTSTESNMKLMMWRKKMIKDMGGVKPFVEYNRGLIRQGGSLHALLEKRLRGQEIRDGDIPDANRGHWKSIQPVLNDMGPVDIHEKTVIHPYLGYMGIIDALGYYKDTLCAIEWKTSAKPKPNLLKTIDTPLQIAAYMGALNWEPKSMFSDNEKQQTSNITNALIVIAYETGEPADVFLLPRDMTLYYWGEWRQRLAKFWAHKLVTYMNLT